MSLPALAQQSGSCNIQSSTEKILQNETPGQWLDSAPAKSKKAKNIIIIIGDGMGTAQVYASVVAQKGASNFLRFPFSSV